MRQGVLLAGCIGGQGEAPPEPCAEPTTADCILAVYTGAPVDDATAADIPESALIPPDAHGRYHVERGQQVTGHGRLAAGGLRPLLPAAAAVPVAGSAP